MPDPLTQRPRHRKRPDAATIDHVVPRTLGGIATWINEVAACRRCNAAKADRPVSFREVWRLVWLKREDLLAYADDVLSAVPELSGRKKAPGEPGAQV